MAIFGDQGPPWVLAYGFDMDSPVIPALRRLAPVVTLLENDDPDLQVRQADYAAIVVRGNVRAVEKHLHIIQFGGSVTLDTFREVQGQSTAIFRIENELLGRAGKLDVPSGLPDEVDKLARTSLAPWLLEISPRDVLFSDVFSRRGERFNLTQIMTPVVSELEGRPCAAFWQRSPEDDSPVQHWWFPEGTPDEEIWIAAIFGLWRQSDPLRFPATAEWLSDPTWMTKSELDAVTELARAEVEFSRISREFEVKLLGLKEQVERVRSDANLKERRLLTTQGDDLKEEVAATLEELGFHVLDSDQDRIAEGSSLLEDLEIRDSNDWVAIAEVRGYSRGAKTSDIQRIARAARGFERRYGREPDSRWYVVNHNLAKPPGDRRVVLAGAESDVEEFAADNGCVIDTRDLFQLRESVRNGRLTSEEARSQLRASRGVFVHT